MHLSSYSRLSVHTPAASGMPLNIPGILVPIQLLWCPRLVIPSVVVKDIRQIDFAALKKAGYRGAVFDKDNCLTIPHRDKLVPELEEAWKQCKETFGEGNVLIVSNSAGTALDAGGIQAESVGYHLGVPVLFHKSFKPAYSCINAIKSYFSTRQPPIRENELIVVGDRIFTDVVLANRMHGRYQRSLPKPTPDSSEKLLPTTQLPRTLAIWTTGVWKRESMAMRWLEKRLVDSVQRLSTPKPGEVLDVARFVKELPPSPPIPKWYAVSRLRNLLSRSP